MTADARFWNDIADKYSRKPVEDPAAFERKIEITKGRMTRESVVLDIGCGTGSLALRLADSGRHVHGLDVSTAMIAIAKGKTSAQKVGNVTFHTGAFDDSFAAFRPESLDGICAYSLLHLVENRPETLAHIYRLLKPGGFFISSTVCLGGSWIPYRPILAVMRWIGKAPMVKLFSRGTLVSEIEKAGFIEVAETDVGADSTIAFVVATKPRVP